MNFLRASIRQVMGCIILVTALAAQSQEFPSKPIRIISPFSAGSSTDLIARVIGLKITENTGQQVIVDTRPGANGIIGVDLAAKAAPKASVSASSVVRPFSSFAISNTACA